MRCALPLIAAACLIRPAQAAVTMVMQEVEGGILLSGSGSFAEPVTYDTPYNPFEMGIMPYDAIAVIGGGLAYFLGEGFSGPNRLGPSDWEWIATDVSGDQFGIYGAQGIVAPSDYIWGTYLSGTAFFANLSFAGLTLTPGTYVWTWNVAGGGTDSLTLQIIPEPTQWALVGVGLVGLGLVASRKRRAARS